MAAKKYLPLAIVNAFLTTVEDGKFFTVTFDKVEGGKRTLTSCRLGVTKDLKGGESTTAHIEEIQNVFVGNLQARRCFYKTRVLELRSSGFVIKRAPTKRRVRTAR